MFTKYTKASAEQFCLAWWYRMAFFTRVWVEHDCSRDFEFTDDHKDAYEEPGGSTMPSVTRGALQRRARLFVECAGRRQLGMALTWIEGFWN